MFLQSSFVSRLVLRDTPPQTSLPCCIHSHSHTHTFFISLHVPKLHETEFPAVFTSSRWLHGFSWQHPASTGSRAAGTLQMNGAVYAFMCECVWLQLGDWGKQLLFDAAGNEKGCWQHHSPYTSRWVVDECLFTCVLYMRSTNHGSLTVYGNIVRTYRHIN